MSDAALVLARADELGAISEEPDKLTRRFATHALDRAASVAAGWMERAGMAVRRDAVGNVVGRYAGDGDGTLALGSHLDTVRDAGRYDGALGVLVALAVVERLAMQKRRLPFAVEVVGFSDEEGVRFGAGYLGSSAWCGTFDRALLDRVDAGGLTMAEAIREAGGDIDAIPRDSRHLAGLLGYLEVHIEQGPVLEEAGQPVGVVSSIVGQTRGRIALAGRAGHAGTVPMPMRRDALAGAAEVVLAVEELARTRAGLLGTVGMLDVHPAASNVIPGRAVVSVDLRHAEDGARDDAWRTLVARAESVATARGLEATCDVLQDVDAVPLSPWLTGAMAEAAAACGVAPRSLVSGAGHDAAVVSRVAPAAMLFVRCAGGVSHHPAEAVTAADVAVAIAVLEKCVDLVARAAADGENGG
jgi:hydantoinase/carbamoylase family amidase